MSIDRPERDGGQSPVSGAGAVSLRRVTDALNLKRTGTGDLRDLGIVFTLILLFIVLSFASPVFFTTTNLLNVVDQWSTIGIMACALTLLLISGGFDLSMGAVFALAGVIAARIAVDHGVVVGLIAGCLSGLVAGILNGLVVNVLRVNAFVATLATSVMAGGAALAITDSLVIQVPDPAFSTIGNDELLGIDYTVWIFVVVVMLVALLLHRTAYGRYLYAIGGNAEAARLSGIRTGLVSTSAFALSGFAAGIAGVIAASRVSAGQADAGGYQLLFDIFAVVVIGGTSIAGGMGAIWRTVVGVFLLALIGNGFNLLAVDRVYQSIVFGALILFAVVLDVWSRRSRV